MAAGAQLSITDLRRATRHPVEHRVIGEHRQRGDVQIEIINISAQGFMAAGDIGLDRGERVVIRLPVVGRIEAHVIWQTEDRSGFQFERVLRLDDFLMMINALQVNPKLRSLR